MEVEIVRDEMNKVRRHKSRKSGNYIKTGITFITSFLILFALGVITRLLILQKYYASLTKLGFYEVNTLSLLIYLGAVIILTILIYEMTEKLDNHPISIGLLLATVFSLPTLINAVYYTIPFQISYTIIVSNYISLMLASYVFAKMNE